MKKLLFTFLLSLLFMVIKAQEIKHFEAYLKLSDMGTRYVAVLEDNTIWWFSPENGWAESSSAGLPQGYNIKHFKAYSKEDGSSRYVAVLSDNTIWWFSPNNNWSKSSTTGLPANYKIKEFEAYTKADGTRYVAVLEDNSVYWFSPNNGWTKSSMEGLKQ